MAAKKKQSATMQATLLAGKPMMQTVVSMKKTAPKGKEASSKPRNKK